MSVEEAREDSQHADALSQEEEDLAQHKTAVTLENALEQLTTIANQLLERHRELDEEAQAIQLEMMELYQAQDARLQALASRLEHASANILTFQDGDMTNNTQQESDSVQEQDSMFIGELDSQTDPQEHDQDQQDPAEVDDDMDAMG